MSEPCEECSCGLSDSEKEVQTAEIPCQIQFEEFVRSYILDQLDIDDESTFIDRVTICPQKLEVEYRNYS